MGSYYSLIFLGWHPSHGIFRMPWILKRDQWLYFGLFTWLCLTCHHNLQGPSTEPLRRMLPFFTLLLLIFMTIHLNIHSPSNLQHKLFIHYWNHFKREGLLFLSCFSGSPHLLGMGRRPFAPSLHRGHLCWDLSTLLASHFSSCKGLLLLSTSHFIVGYMEGHHCHPSKVIICR